jgi:membrane protease YdiL (CAAX protease family)
MKQLGSALLNILVFVVLWFVLDWIVSRLTFFVFGEWHYPWMPFLLRGKAGSLVACAGAYAIVTRLKRPSYLKSLPLNFGYLVVGALIGIGIQAFVFWLGVQTGFLHVTGVLGGFPFLEYAALAILVAISEELAHRQFILVKLEAVLGSGWALSISSIIFALFHVNYGLTLLSPGSHQIGLMVVLLKAFIGGVVMGSAYLATRRLGLSIGVHAGWDFAVSYLYGLGWVGGAITYWQPVKMSVPWFAIWYVIFFVVSAAFCAYSKRHKNWRTAQPLMDGRC